MVGHERPYRGREGEHAAPQCTSGGFGGKLNHVQFMLLS